MARPREFDAEAAVRAATGSFCRRGFAATSVDDLVRATGVHRGSLYRTFGSKRGLFFDALEAASAETATTAALLDLCIIALLELVPGDTDARERVLRVLSEHSLTRQELGGRLIERARLNEEMTP